MPIARRVSGPNPAPVVKLRPVPGTKQTFARPAINRVTGELATVIAKFRNRPGLFTFGNQSEFDAGRLPLGILGIDLGLAGGLKRSRGSMLYGEKSTGKSTLAAKAIASAQRTEPDSIGVILDVEGTVDLPWLARNGVDLDRLLVVEPESGEEAVDIADAVFRTNDVCIVVTDSIAMLVPMKEISASAADSLPGIHARLIGNYLRRLTSAMLVERHRGHFPLLLYINQFRMRIGVLFGDPRTLPGGKALEFCTSQQLLTYNKEIKYDPKGEKGFNPNKDVVMYNEHEVHVTKDKTGGKIKVAKFKLIRDEDLTGLPVGYVEQPRTLVNWGRPAGIVDGPQTGPYTLGEFGSFRSYDNINKFFVENPDAERHLHAQVIAYWREKWQVS